MATHKANGSLGGMIQNPHVEREMDMAKAEEASCAAGQRTGRTTRVSFMVASEQWERHQNGKRLRKENSEPASALGDWKRRMERAVRHQPCEVTQLHQPIDRMARMLEAHAASVSKGSIFGTGRF